MSKPKPIATIHNTTGEFLFGNINNIYAAHKVGEAAVTSIPVEGGTVLMNIVNTRFPAVQGTWNIYRGHSKEDTEYKSLYYAVNEDALVDQDAVSSLRHLLTIAGPQKFQNNDEVLNNHCYIINRYDWDYYVTTDMDRELFEKVTGPTCFLIQPDKYDEVWQWVTDPELEQIEESRAFDEHGYVMVFAQQEYVILHAYLRIRYMHGRILMNAENDKMVGFAFFTHYGNFKDLCLDGVETGFSYSF